jgi:hypothetical protein
VKKSVHGSRASPRTGSHIWKFKYLAVRPERVEGQRPIFSQLPFFKGGIVSVTPLTPLRKKGEGKIFGPNGAAIIQRISDTLANTFERRCAFADLVAGAFAASEQQKHQCDFFEHFPSLRVAKRH